MGLQGKPSFIVHLVTDVTPTDLTQTGTWMGAQLRSSWRQSVATSKPFPCLQKGSKWILTTVSGFSWARWDRFPLHFSHPKYFQLMAFGMAEKLDEFKELLPKVPLDKVATTTDSSARSCCFKGEHPTSPTEHFVARTRKIWKSIGCGGAFGIRVFFLFVLFSRPQTAQ